MLMLNEVKKFPTMTHPNQVPQKNDLLQHIKKFKFRFTSCATHLINLCPNELLAVELRGHQLLYDVNQAPESVLLVHEEQGYSGDPVEPLTVLHLRIVQTIR